MAKKLADVDLADDMVALVTDCIEKAQHLLRKLEAAASSLGLAMNNSRTEFITVNIIKEECSLSSGSWRQLRHVSQQPRGTSVSEKLRHGLLAISCRKCESLTLEQF